MVWVQPTPPIGLVHGMQSAFGGVATSFALVLHEDMQVPMYDHTWLRRMLERMENPQVGAIWPCLTASNAEDGRLGKFQCGQDWEDLSIGHEGMLVRMAAWRQVGEFDVLYDTPSADGLFNSFWDDVDFSLRLRIAGYTLLTANDVLLWHDGSATVRRDRGEWVNAFRAGLLRIYRKFGPDKLRLATTYLETMTSEQRATWNSMVKDAEEADIANGVSHA